MTKVVFELIYRDLLNVMHHDMRKVIALFEYFEKDVDSVTSVFGDIKEEIDNFDIKEGAVDNAFWLRKDLYYKKDGVFYLKE